MGGYHFAKDDIVLLWITITTDEQKSVDKNFTPWLRLIQNILKQWSRRKLSLKGKITIINALALSLVVYPTSGLATQIIVLEEINRLLYYGRVSLPKFYMPSLLLYVIFAMLTILSSIKRFPHIKLVSLYFIMNIWYSKLYILLHFLTSQNYIESIQNAIINMFNVDSVIHMHSQKFIFPSWRVKILKWKHHFKCLKTTFSLLIMTHTISNMAYSTQHFNHRIMMSAKWGQQNMYLVTPVLNN